MLPVTGCLAYGCAGGDPTPEDTWVAIDAVPDGARCIHVSGAASEQRFDVAGAPAALLHVDALPLTGELEVVAFADHCDAVATGGAAAPDWISDPATVQRRDGARVWVVRALHADRDRSHLHHCPDGPGGGDAGSTDASLRIEQVRYRGSGCPAGSVGVALSPDHQAATVTYSAYTASAGPGADPGELNKRCNLDFIVHVPQGRSFAVSNIHYRGFVHLDDAMTAALKTRVAIQGGRGRDRKVLRFRGPVDDDYQLDDEVSAAALDWSPCGGRRTIDVDSAVTIDNSQTPTGTGLLTVDSIDHEVVQTYRVVWHSCHDTAMP